MLAKKFRLNKNASYKYLYKNAQSKAADKLCMFFLRGGSVRVGFSVSNKVGKAVVRNKVKRRMRACARELIKLMSVKAQIIFVAKPALANADYNEIASLMRLLMLRAGLIN